MQQSPPDDFSTELERIYDEYWQSIVRYLMKRVYDQERAAELCQETFSHAWTSFLRQDTKLPQTGYHLKNWLFKIAHNVAIDEYRRNKLVDYQPLPESEAYPLFAELVVEGHEDWICDSDRLRQVLAQMPLRYQQCVQLLNDGYEKKQIAVILGISPSRVSDILNEVRTQLQRKLFAVPDLQRAQVWHAEQAMFDLLRGVSRVVDHQKYLAHREKALERAYRKYMKEHSGEVLADLIIPSWGVDKRRNEHWITAYDDSTSGLEDRGMYHEDEGLHHILITASHVRRG